MRSDEAARQGGPDDIDSPDDTAAAAGQGVTPEQERGACWITRGSLKLKVVAGMTAEEVDQMVDLTAYGMARLEAARPGAVPAPTTSVQSRIERSLADHGPASITELAADLGIEKDTLRVTLNRGKAKHRFASRLEGDVTKWELIPFRDSRLDQ